MFLPKSFDFFDLFESQSKHLMKAMEILRDLKEDGDIKKHARRMKEVEHEGDGITHQILDTLNKTFITPIEREDITHLARCMDDILDETERALNRLSIYRIEPLPLEIFQFMELIDKAVQEVSKGIVELRDPKKKERVLKYCEIINFIENEADDQLRHVLTKLFEKETDYILIMKLKDIYEMLESVTDRCEDVANVLETIVVKNY